MAEEIGISIIIPTYEEAEHIGPLVRFLKAYGQPYVREILVVDGGSKDRTLEIAGQAGAKTLLAPQRGRPHQLNHGASNATQPILYFVHADVIPPKSFATDLVREIKAGFQTGGFRYQFRSPSPLLQINAWFTRFDFLFCRGGDQTIFMTREFFDQVSGFDESYIVMEDFDYVRRARKRTPYRIIQKDVIVSDRKYQHNSYIRVNLANLVAFTMFRLGYPPEKMRKAYCRILKGPGKYQITRTES